MTDDELRDRLAEALAERYTSPRWEWNEDKTDYRAVDTAADRLDRGMADVGIAADGHPSIGPVTPREAINAVLPLVRAEIAAAEHRGAELAAQAIEEMRAAKGVTPYWADDESLRLAARFAREAVPAPTGGNA